MMPEIILASVLLSMSHMSAVDVQHRLERLLVVGRVLYVAAHPDDENTQLLSYLTHARHVRTAYLSLTRGDGGQNLIGSEQSPLLGVIRTSELLAARRIDGAEQLFTRARDFSYSKSSEETIEVWGREPTLADMVWAVRHFRPHVMVTRFPEQGPTHGHHLASAILAREAFEAAGDASRFSEQLETVSTWKPHRLVYNVPNRFMPQEERDDDLVVDIGGYDQTRGASYGEIAAASRSMHKSQGFGAARRFGPEPERFRHLAGARAETDLLEGIPLGWQGVEGAADMAAALEQAATTFRPTEPGAIAPALAEALRATAQIEDAPLRAWAEREITELLVGTSGLLIEARSDVAAVTPGSAIDVKVTALARNDVPVQWHSAEILTKTQQVDARLEHNQPKEVALTAAVPEDAPLSTLPWLTEEALPGRYQGEGPPHEPLPEPRLQARLVLDIAGAAVAIAVPVRHFWVDRVEGELFRDVEVLPTISATPEAKAAMVPCDSQGACTTTLRVALRVRAPGKLRVEAPEGYRIEPAAFEVSSDTEIALTITATPGAPPGPLRLVATSGSGSSLAEFPIRHRHIPERTVLLPAEVALSSAELSVPGHLIGHVAGPGDEVAHSLRRVGFRIEDIDDEMLAHGELDRFGAIVVGVRAFNTNEALRRHHARLFSFAERGGTVVVQYATKPRREPLDVPLLPYEMELGRGRVTDQRAAVTLLNPEHPVMRSPHVITQSDFSGWVHERGLYFGASWDEEHITPLFSMADRGADAEEGSLLVADHGSGRVIYVGLSLFRQIPAGVPGAYRLITNLLSRRDGAHDGEGADAPPPVLGSWRNFYLVVLMILVVLIGSFYLLTRRYST